MTCLQMMTRRKKYSSIQNFIFNFQFFFFFFFFNRSIGFSTRVETSCPTLLDIPSKRRELTIGDKSPPCFASRTLSTDAIRFLALSDERREAFIGIHVAYSSTEMQSQICLSVALASSSISENSDIASTERLPIGTGVGIGVSGSQVGGNVLNAFHSATFAVSTSIPRAGSFVIVIKLQSTQVGSNSMSILVTEPDSPASEFKGGVSNVPLASLRAISVVGGCSTGTPFKVRAVRIASSLSEAITLTAGVVVPATPRPDTERGCADNDDCVSCITGVFSCHWCPGASTFGQAKCINSNTICDSSLVTEKDKCPRDEPGSTTRNVVAPSTTSGSSVAARTTCDDITRCGTCMLAGCNWCGHPTGHGYCITVSDTARCGAAFSATNTASRCPANDANAINTVSAPGDGQQAGGGDSSSSLIIGAVLGGVGLCIALIALIAVGIMCRRNKLIGDLNLRDVETVSVSQGAYGSTASLSGDAASEYGNLKITPASSNRNLEVSTYGGVGPGTPPSTGYASVPPLGGPSQYGLSPNELRQRDYSPMGMK
jgi:hypothetical protein